MKSALLLVLTFPVSLFADNLPKINEEKTIVATIHGEVRALDKNDQKLIDDVRWSLRNEKADDLKYTEKTAFKIKNKRHRALWLELIYLARQLLDYPECEVRKQWLSNHRSQSAEVYCGGQRNRCGLTDSQEKEIYRWALVYIESTGKKRFACR